MVALKILGWGSVALLETWLMMNGMAWPALAVLLFVAGWMGW